MGTRMGTSVMRASALSPHVFLSFTPLSSLAGKGVDLPDFSTPVLVQRESPLVPETLD